VRGGIGGNVDGLRRAWLSTDCHTGNRMPRSGVRMDAPVWH
jgi:hypothetical protein